MIILILDTVFFVVAAIAILGAGLAQEPEISERCSLMAVALVIFACGAKYVFGG